MTASHQTPNELIEEHQRLVYSLANKIHSKLPPHIPLEDIVCYGQLGLTQAARSFQANESSTFATFAFYRIRGAIFDGLTKMNWSSRSAYQRMKAEQMANEVLESGRRQGAAGDAEAEAKWFAETSERLAIVYLTSGAGEDEGEFVVEDRKVGTPDAIAETSELCLALKGAIDKLPEPGKTLIRLSYFEGLSLAEAADQLGKSRSWASRLHARILSQLAHSLGVETVS